MWKWIAGLLVAILLAGSPGIIYAVRAPTQDDVTVISDKQQVILERLAGLDVEIANLNMQVDELQAELRRHEDNSTGR